MRFKTGDRVRYLNEVGEGTVVRIMPDNIVYIEDEDGFEVPVKASELVKVASQGLTESEEEEPAFAAVDEQSPEPAFNLTDVDLREKNNTSINVVLALVPNRPKNLSISDLDLYLINDSNYGLLYHCGTLDEEDTVQRIAAGMLEDNTKIYLQSFSQSDLSKTNFLVLQYIPFGETLYRLQEPKHISYALSGFDFYRAKSYNENEFFDDKAIILGDGEEKKQLQQAIDKLTTSDLGIVVKEKGDIREPKAVKPKKESSDIEEVDLHIHEIMDNFEGLSNGEIIQIQLDRFETALMGAITGETKKIVFIHGVGNGKLKHELRKKLERKYPQLEYQDASFREYGFGATMVIVRR